MPIPAPQNSVPGRGVGAFVSAHDVFHRSNASPTQ